MPNSYIKAGTEAGKDFFLSPINGPIPMLNLLRFKERTYYSLFPEFDPGSTLTGRKAYDMYIKVLLLISMALGAKSSLEGIVVSS